MKQKHCFFLPTLLTSLNLTSLRRVRTITRKIIIVTFLTITVWFVLLFGVTSQGTRHKTLMKNFVLYAQQEIKGAHAAGIIPCKRKDNNSFVCFLVWYPFYVKQGFEGCAEHVSYAKKGNPIKIFLLALFFSLTGFLRDTKSSFA